MNHILSLILFFPALGAILLALLPKDQVKLFRWAALCFTLVFHLG
jgi:NADH:ubiquinone oxidoreductase subunit 4 (subunit M)